jgi:hypothetical protein
MIHYFVIFDLNKSKQPPLPIFLLLLLFFISTLQIINLICYCQFSSVIHNIFFVSLLVFLFIRFSLFLHPIIFNNQPFTTTFILLYSLLSCLFHFFCLSIPGCFLSQPIVCFLVPIVTHHFYLFTTISLPTPLILFVVSTNHFSFFFISLTNLSPPLNLLFQIELLPSHHYFFSFQIAQHHLSLYFILVSLSKNASSNFDWLAI